jgi:hypothetical protein
MRVKDLGTRPAPAAIREILSRFVRGRGPAIPVERRQVPYWQERGWTRTGDTYGGSYQTPYGAFQGWIEQQSSGQLSFFLHGPSQQIRRHSHWTCFQDRGDGWYLVHMGRAPRDVSSGIMTIERLITEAHENN